MIVSVDIVNFQSHPDTHIDFTNGLNVLVGSSRSGKSAIRRAIMWVITNRPSGLGVVSWWNKKGDKLLGETKVTITLDNSTVISRVRSPELNGYIINGKVLEAVATGVPEEIQEAFKMADVNMSGQFDAPFLVSQSAGAVAQYLNEIINLEDADYYQKEVESDRRKCVTDAGDNNKKILELSETIKEFGWLDRAEEITASIKEKLSHYDSISSELVKIRNLSSTLTEAHEKESQLLPITIKVAKLSASIREKQAKYEKLRLEVQNVKALQKTLQESQKILTVPLSGIDRCIRRITKQKATYDALKGEVVSITNLKEQYTENCEVCTNVDRELKATQRELSLIDLCPLCSAKRDHVEVHF